MKRQVLIPGLCVLLCVVLFAAAYFLTDPKAPDEETKPTETEEPTAPEGSTEATVNTTVPTTEPTVQTTQPTTQPTTRPTEPDPGYYVPESYLEISTKPFVMAPPVLPIPGDDAPQEQWLTFFYSLLKPSGSWYNMALIGEYESPEYVDLNLLFYNGISSDSDLTQEESQFLEAEGFQLALDTARMPKEEVESILEIYFGTSLEACGKMQPVELTYFEQTDCYYVCTSSRGYAEVHGIVDYTVLENGDYCVRYVGGYREKEYEVVLHRVDDHFQVVSNLPAEENKSTNDQIPCGNFRRGSLHLY